MVPCFAPAPALPGSPSRRRLQASPPPSSPRHHPRRPSEARRPARKATARHLRPERPLALVRDYGEPTTRSAPVVGGSVSYAVVSAPFGWLLVQVGRRAGATATARPAACSNWRDGRWGSSPCHPASACDGICKRARVLRPPAAAFAAGMRWQGGVTGGMAYGGDQDHAELKLQQDPV